jgi:hypothetical protein
MEWKKSKAKAKDLLALLNSGFLQEKEVDMWRAAAGDPYPMEKNLDEIPMFARFVERGPGWPSQQAISSRGFLSITVSSTSTSTPVASSTFLSSSIFAKRSWGSSPTEYYSGSSSA